MPGRVSGTCIMEGHDIGSPISTPILFTTSVMMPLPPPLLPYHYSFLPFQKDDDVELPASARASSWWDRLTFKIILSYHGPSFDGWQKQPSPLYIVQGLLERILGRFVDVKKAQQLRDKSLPLEGCAVVASRTDKGVTDLCQVCSFYTWNKYINCQDIMAAINDASRGILRVVSVSKADTGLRVMCVELVVNRFLRKMVRVLVATAIREAAVGANDDGLIKLMDASCRRATAPPAPSNGLCLVDVGYQDFEREICFIQ